MSISNTTVTRINGICDDLVRRGEFFTALNVSKKVQQEAKSRGEAIERHKTMRKVVHARMAYHAGVSGYKREAMDINGERVWVYHNPRTHKISGNKILKLDNWGHAVAVASEAPRKAARVSPEVAFAAPRGRIHANPVKVPSEADTKINLLEGKLRSLESGIEARHGEISTKLDKLAHATLQNREVVKQVRSETAALQSEAFAKLDKLAYATVANREAQGEVFAKLDKLAHVAVQNRKDQSEIFTKLDKLAHATVQNRENLAEALSDIGDDMDETYNEVSVKLDKLARATIKHRRQLSGATKEVSVKLDESRKAAVEAKAEVTNTVQTQRDALKRSLVLGASMATLSQIMLLVMAILTVIAAAVATYFGGSITSVMSSVDGMSFGGYINDNFGRNLVLSFAAIGFSLPFLMVGVLTARVTSAVGSFWKASRKPQGLKSLPDSLA